MPRVERPRRWSERAGALGVSAVGAIATVGLVFAVVSPESSTTKLVLFGILSLCLAVPLATFLVRWIGVIGRRVAARLAIRRARGTFRAALRAARRHPELADLDRLREAAAVLVRHGCVDYAAGFPEVVRAAQHPYAPIRDAGRLVLGRAGGPTTHMTTPSGPGV